MSRKTVGRQATHEVLRAFLALAENLNLSEASEELGVTRQTLRRYIDVLEDMKGAALFDLKKNNYVLTSAGEASLAEARYILNRTEKFCSPNYRALGASPYLNTTFFIDQEGRSFRSEQHPISAISKLACPLLQRAHSAWANAAMKLEAAEMKSIRPYFVVYRQDVQGWRCVEIGNTSAYARWFGWTWSKSAVGKLSYQDNAGDEFDAIVSDTYAEVFGRGDARLDHVFAHLPRESESGPVPVTFQRLLLTCILPDNTPVIAVLVAITNDVKISGLESAQLGLVSESLDMKSE